mmetsp:Transcript_33357/g.76284  ORF Transcript_33357/g.76284 Transcript_33357/m.76284 type:complete len:368 (+) Transcript_33357:58-1161(+)
MAADSGRKASPPAEAGEGDGGGGLRPGATLDDFNAFIQKGSLGHNRHAMVDNPGKVEDLAVQFYTLNEDPKTSPNLEVEDFDDTAFLMDCLDDPKAQCDPDMALSLLRVLKVLSRKEANRETVESHDIKIILSFISRKDSLSVPGEACSVLLNMCYGKDNTLAVIEHGGVAPLIRLLNSPSEEVQTNAAGAIQSMSFQSEGRHELREGNLFPSLFPLLDHASVKLRTRCVGVLHNMSSDVGSIALIRTMNIIPKLIRMLSDPQVAICGSAAGAIQNISREAASKQVIVDLDGIPPLTDLLFGSDIQTQTCAGGALLNLLGPGLEADPVTGLQTPQHLANRQALSKIVMLSLVTGMAFHGLYGDDDPE